MHKFFQNKLNLLFVGLKQFGTGIILSTAFIHVSLYISIMCYTKIVTDSLSIVIHACIDDVQQ